MKKLVIISLSMLVAACSSGTDTANVSSESYREDFQTTMSSPAMAAPMNEEMMPTAVEPQAEMAAAPKSDKPTQVRLIAPTKEQLAKHPRFGYTIQIVAVGTQEKLRRFVAKLPQDGQPNWSNYKVVNGTKWYTVLHGDYGTKQEALLAISKLSLELQNLKPFVKSIDDIKNSAYPNLDKIQ